MRRHRAEAALVKDTADADDRRSFDAPFHRVVRRRSRAGWLSQAAVRTELFEFAPRGAGGTEPPSLGTISVS